MVNTARLSRIISCYLFCFVLCFCCAGVFAQGTKTIQRGEPEKTEAQLQLEEKGKEAENGKKEMGKSGKEEITEKDIDKIKLPEDTSPRLSVREIRISGNTLIPTKKLLKNIPEIYNTSDKPLGEAESRYLFDFRALKEIIKAPGEAREISARTIQGFNQYILSVYQKKNFAGIYVYVPTEAMKGAELKDGVLPIEVMEAKVSSVAIRYFDVNGKEVNEGRLKRSIVKEWSPVKEGKVADNKKIDDFINLLNLNPDRRIYATVSKGTEPNSLALGYDVYELNPWHYFFQIDNSGTKDQRWTPRLGFINTNLTGRDDKLTGLIQFRPESGIEDNYGGFASYDFPLWTPRLRLMIFGGRSEFDVQAPGDIDFLGHGSYYGGILRFNAYQQDDWFFDILGSIKHEESKFTPSLFPGTFGSDLRIDLWGVGAEIHRTDDMSMTSFTFWRNESMNSSDSDEFEKARPGSNPDFTILTFSAAHQRFLDIDKVHRILGSFTGIWPSTRLAPVEMTTFGGMYTVRGYEEAAVVADGGYLGSIQYEYDIIRAMQVKQPKEDRASNRKPWLRKVAPCGFFDFAKANIEHPRAGEKGSEDLYSVGLGVIWEIGENFNGGLYYGFPLVDTDTVEKGNGVLNISVMARW